MRPANHGCDTKKKSPISVEEDSLRNHPEGGAPEWIVANIDSWIVRDEDLIGETNQPTRPEIKELPVIYVKIAGLTIKCLTDTGASISLITQPLIKELERRVRIPIIPIAQVKIKGIIPDRTAECKFQVFLDLEVQNHIFPHTFMVIGRSSYNIILGADFMREYGAIIDLKENRIRFRMGNNNTDHVDLRLDQRDPTDQEGIWVIQTEEEGGNWNKIYEDNIAQEVEIYSADVEFETLIQEKLDEAKIGAEHQGRLKEILEAHKDTFDSRPGKILNYQYAMQLNDWSPFKGKLYPVAEKYHAQVKTTIREMEEAQIITKMATPYLNSLVVVLKQDGTTRVCLDARTLNARLLPEYDQAPKIKDVLKQFRGKRYFTSIDLTSSYHHLELEERSKLLTGFMFDQQTYCFQRLPFGVRTAGSALIRALERNLTPEVKESTVRYVDDILLASKTLSEHLHNLEQLLENLHQANFKINMKKSHFCQKEILYLGHIVDGEGIRPNPAKVEAIRNFPKPTRIKHIRQFLGMCNFFSDHVPNYTDTVAPLQDLLKSNNRWKWGERSEEAFNRTKELLVENIKLGYPDYNHKFIIQSDASRIGIGAMLYQENPQQRTYLAFISRKLRPHEVNYTVTELEMLAIIYALQKWRKLIYGFKILLRTDHKALTFLLKTSIASERVNRWALYVQQYDIDIEHCPGKENLIPDALSRNPEDQEEEVNQVELVQDDHDFLRKLQDLGREQETDPWAKMLIDYLRRRLQPGTPIYEEAEKIAQEFNFFNGMLHKFVDEEHTRLRLVVPPSLQRGLVWHVHRVCGHSGVDKTCAVIQESFCWPRLRVTVRDVLRTCDVCQRIKHNTFLMKQYPRPILSTKPREVYAVDLYGPLPSAVRGNKHILVCLDIFSKMVVLCPIQKATSKQVLLKLKNKILPILGKPAFLLSDHGSCFTSAEFKRELERLEIRHILSSIRHPQSNPSERVLREVAKFCRIYCPEAHWRWIGVLPIIESCINNTIHESTGQIPSVVHFNRYPERPWHNVISCPIDARPGHEMKIAETAEHLKNQAERRLRRVRNRRFHRPLRVGEQVLVKRPAVSNPQARFYAKFAAIYAGPYEIIQSLGNNSYRVREMNGEAEAIYNAANLKLYYPPAGIEGEQVNIVSTEGVELRTTDELPVITSASKQIEEDTCYCGLQEVYQVLAQCITEALSENRRLKVEQETLVKYHQTSVARSDKRKV